MTRSRYERDLKAASPIVWLLAWPALLFLLTGIAIACHGCL